MNVMIVIIVHVSYVLHILMLLQTEGSRTKFETEIVTDKPEYQLSFSTRHKIQQNLRAKDPRGEVKGFT